MQLFAIGHNQETAPVELREKFSFGPAELVPALQELRAQQVAREAVIVSTCNRNEIYTVVPDIDAARDRLSDFFHDFHGVERGMIAHSLYALTQEQVVEHLFQVTAGIDSMVVGETQIFSQVKDAFQQAHNHQCTGPVLNRLFLRSFETGKRVRHQTRISQGSVSMSSCAVQLARKIFSDLSDKTTVLIGAGETSEQTARNLLSAGAGNFIIANRTVERAAELADRLGGAGIPLEQLMSALASADIVISSTASPEFLLTYADVKKLMQVRKNAPLFIIDLSVPRDIEPEIKKIGNVFLYDVDGLEAITADNRDRRSGEVETAMKIISEEVSHYMDWYRSLDVTPTIVELRNSFEEVQRRELEKLKGKVSSEEYARLESHSRSLVKKLLHLPTAEIKRSVSRGEGGYTNYVVRKLFHLDRNEDD
jgi:glutamyl-tRNA reductase